MNRFLVLQTILQFGSFTKAADALGYTQSAISQAVASLETEFDVKLLNRSRNGVALTIAGQQLYPLMQQTLRQYQAVKETASAIRGLDTGLVRIGTYSSITRTWLPKLIKSFQQDYPNVDFVFYMGDYSAIGEWLRTNMIDFGITSPVGTQGFQTVPIKRGDMLAVLPEQHPLAQLTAVPIEKLATDPFILLEEGSYSEPLTAFQRAGVTPNVKFRVHDDYAIMTMVEAGLGVSILAELTLQRMPFKLATRPLTPPLTREIALAYRDWDSLPIASQTFINQLLAQQDQLP
jgi:DNA-binding transcriptional LysR family regulator